jgi:flagellar assembly factor FliW
MSTIKVQTARFGEIEVDESKIIHFVSPVLGFDNLLEYVILDHAQDSPFKWLQCIPDPGLAFVVTNPRLFGLDYHFTITPEDAKKLDLTNNEDALVVTIVNIPQENPEKMTTNLLGPIVINQKAMKAMQIVLNDVEYSTKTRLISDEILQQQAAAAQKNG